ncbi:hypothetical protein llap_18323 [Limosa lapponica baueri]|uniref:Uncharacterized protein n=1 Tax=Limosa lapponica baueri TaxID=1758121 RepID=A0A2I0TC53_LIMLA|nr:hypothetical protein llap_18323 [Limosa lapponica baueri]
MESPARPQGEPGTAETPARQPRSICSIICTSHSHPHRCREPSRREKGRAPTSARSSPPDLARAEGSISVKATLRRSPDPSQGSSAWLGTGAINLAGYTPNSQGFSRPLLLTAVAMRLRDVKTLLRTRSYMNVLGLNPTWSGALAFQQTAIPVAATHASLSRTGVTAPKNKAMV